MRISPRFLVLASACLAGVFACPGAASAQQPAAHQASAPQRAPTVVVVDIAKVFKTHGRFNQAMEFMKKDVEDFENILKSERSRVQAAVENLQTLKSGTLERKKAEEDIARLTSELQVKAQLKAKEFREKEAKLYFDTYTEVTGYIAKFADQNGISLVIRYNSEPIAPDDRNSILQGVNNMVVFQRNLDITAVITQAFAMAVVPKPVPGPVPHRK